MIRTELLLNELADRLEEEGDTLGCFICREAAKHISDLNNFLLRHMEDSK